MFLLLAFKLSALLALLLAAVAIRLFSRLCEGQIGGHTGDTIGAAQQIGEAHASCRPGVCGNYRPWLTLVRSRHVRSQRQPESLRLVYLSVLLVMLVGSVGLGRTRSAAKFRYLGIWVLIAVALVVLYTYRASVLDVAAPVLSELTPSHVVEVVGPDGERQLVIRRANDGHFKVDAEVNGVPIRFLIDTGATTTVLTTSDARRAGIDTASLTFDRAVQTANGLAFFARTWLNSLAIGPYRLGSVPVGVMPTGAMDTSLLGMSTINRFSSWRVEGDRMVLVP